LNVSKKYQDLFKAIAGHLDVDTIIITGGRDSAKSFTTSLALGHGVINFNHRVLYTRYTLTSAADSVIPDMLEKVKILNYDRYFRINKDRLNSTVNTGKIVFKGIKTGSGTQTANLKSLKDFSIFIVEEAEELPTFEVWDKIQLSIRATDVQALSILVLNPTTRKHWIYEEFFADRGVKAGFNGVKGNVLYIHTTYLDVAQEHIAPKNFAKYEAARMAYELLEPMENFERTKQPKKLIKQWKYYKYTVLGGWLESAEGLVYEDWDTFEDFPEETSNDIRLYGLDWGFSNDPAAFVEILIKYTKGESEPNELYVKCHIYKTGLLNSDLAEMIKSVMGKNLEDTYIIADSSEPKSIAEMQKYGLPVLGAKKGAGSILSGIKKVCNFDLYVHVDSHEIQDELRHYHKLEVTNAKGERITHVVDKDNHALDAIRYAANLY